MEEFINVTAFEVLIYVLMFMVGYFTCRVISARKFVDFLNSLSESTLLLVQKDVNASAQEAKSE